MIPSKVRQRVWRGVADGRRLVTRSGSPRHALDALGDPDRRDLNSWLARTSERHLAYRSATPIPDGRVAVVCVSQRPQLALDVVANIERQIHIDRDRIDVVYVANHADDLTPVETALDGWPGAVVERLDPDRSLGEGLNIGLERSDARFVAKFDDDDRYGPHYLADALRAHSYAGAGLVGKHSYYADVVRAGATVLRFPGNEFRYTSTLAGGTLVIDRDRVDDQRFDPISIGEDRAFIAACHRRGISTFSADRFNFTQVRSGDNTWLVDDETFRHGTLDVDPSAGEHRIDR